MNKHIHSRGQWSRYIHVYISTTLSHYVTPSQRHRQEITDRIYYKLLYFRSQVAQINIIFVNRLYHYVNDYTFILEQFSPIYERASFT